VSTTAVGLIPVGIAASWIPVRGSLPNVDIALILVVTVGIVSLLGGRWAAGVGAVTAAVSFDLFDTPPYGRLAMERGSDVATMIVLLAVAFLVGELSVRTVAYRRIAARRSADFAVMSGAAGLMAVGEDAPVIVGALAGELTTTLGLLDCEFEAGPPAGERPVVRRDGTLSHSGSAIDTVDLPVWTGQTVIGRYRLVFPSGQMPDRDRLLTAVAIADQAGAALAALQPAPEQPPPRRLRLIR
jgi:hypothetical protein